MVLPLNDNLKGGDKLEGLAIDLEGYYLVTALGLQLNVLALPHLERLFHANLHLSHMQYVSQSNDLNNSITIGLTDKLILACLPKFVHSSTPVINIKQDKVLILLYVDLFAVDGHFEVLGE